MTGSTKIDNNIAYKTTHPPKKSDLLIAGNISDEHFELLIELSAIRSEKVVMALHQHLVGGMQRKDACKYHGVNAGYFSVAMGRLFRVNQLVSQLAYYYCGS